VLIRTYISTFSCGESNATIQTRTKFTITPTMSWYWFTVVIYLKLWSILEMANYQPLSH
jgi:hypothetical protein